jgi:hypothetical protein
MTMLFSMIASLAIVIQNQTPLRAAPRDTSPQQAVLWQGDALEVRGQTINYLQVYDHRRERAGYVKATQVRIISTEPSDAPELLSVVRFLRDTPGAEALGVSYGAAYLKAVQTAALTVEPFDAIGEMADRLAHRASVNQINSNAAALAAHLEVVAQYGVTMNSFEIDGGVRVCYDGDVFRRVMSAPEADDAQIARAALGLTRHECVDPGLGPGERYAVDQWRANVLDRVKFEGLTDEERARVHARRAGVWAELAFAQERRGESPKSAAERALQELAAVNKSKLSDEDRIDYDDAAIRVGASRWAAQQVGGPVGRLQVRTEAGAPGQTCLKLVDTIANSDQVVIQRCTYGTVWVASASSNAYGTALALAVQPLSSWRELWVFRKNSAGWTVNMIPPGTSPADRGYIEFAGWVPGGEQILTARELESGQQFKRQFEVMNLNTLSVEHHAYTPEYLTAFLRWQDAGWKQQNVAVR